MLHLLSLGEAYGYEIVTTLTERTNGGLEVTDGTLYPVLYRLERAGFVGVRWETPQRGVPRKYYRLTEAGQAELARLTPRVEHVRRAPWPAFFASNRRQHERRPGATSNQRRRCGCRATPELRAQVAMELRSHIAERVEHGQTVEEALQQLGDPVVLAESYLAAVPLIPASFWRRAAARMLDFLFCVVAFAPLAWFLFRTDRHLSWWSLRCRWPACGVGVYPLLAEYDFGKTMGKHLMGLRVVRESGARISFGQSVVRQLPMLPAGVVDRRALRARLQNSISAPLSSFRRRASSWPRRNQS